MTMQKKNALDTLSPGRVKDLWDDYNAPLWEGIPEAVYRRARYDTDTAGGCG